MPEPIFTEANLQTLRDFKKAVEELTVMRDTAEKHKLFGVLETASAFPKEHQDEAASLMEEISLLGD